MKYQLTLCFALFLMTLSQAKAHCPATLKEEKLCFMLDQNLLYAYDSKLEHNGPYKDFEKATLVGIKNKQGSPLKFSKVARGIYKIDSAVQEKMVTATFSLEKKEKQVLIQHEP